MADRHHYFDEFMRTGSETLAVDALVGLFCIAAGLLVVWFVFNDGWGKSRPFVITVAIVATAILVIWPNLPFEGGKLFRAMFLGSAGWISFIALIVLLGFGLGYSRRDNEKKADTAALKQEPQPKTLRAPAEPRPTITQASAVPLPKAKVAPEVARLTRQTQPAAVPDKYRRETLLIGRKKHG